MEHLAGTEQLPDCFTVGANDAARVLLALEEDSGTGPDALATRLLKNCSEPLGKAVAKLTTLLLEAGYWPKQWRLHWVLPLYKKKSVYNPSNYRGIHLSSQLSKVVERLVAELFVPFLENTGVFGGNQFA